jgi:hypothetical protein
MIKAKIQKAILWILFQVNQAKQRLERRKMWRITEDIINLPSKERKQAISKMRYRFRKNKKRGPFVYSWCDEIEMLGKILDDQRSEHGDKIKLKYRNLRAELNALRKGLTPDDKSVK